MTQANEQQVASEMVERVAIAIHDAWGDGYKGRWDPNTPHWSRVYREIARAAIAAMREPTEDMIYGKHVRTTLVSVWQAMIDAALSGSSAGHPGASPTAISDPAGISDAANAARLPEPNLGPEGVS